MATSTQQSVAAVSTIHEVANTRLLTLVDHLAPAHNESPRTSRIVEWSPDGMQITLKLRAGVKFHNIAPVNGRVLGVTTLL